MSCSVRFSAVSGVTLVFLAADLGDRRTRRRPAARPADGRVRSSRKAESARPLAGDTAARPESLDCRPARPQRPTRTHTAGSPTDARRNLRPLGSVPFPLGQIVLIVAPPLVGLLLGAIRLLRSADGPVLRGSPAEIWPALPSLWLDAARADDRRALPIAARSPRPVGRLRPKRIEHGGGAAARDRRIDPGHPLLAGEMAVVQRQIELGATPDVAIRSFAERSDLASLFSLSTLFEQARRFGTSVTECTADAGGNDALPPRAAGGGVGTKGLGENPVPDASLHFSGDFCRAGGTGRRPALRKVLGSAAGRGAEQLIATV